MNKKPSTAEYGTIPETEPAMLKVTFYVFSKILKKEFRNVEMHKSMDDAKLRASALNWQIESVEVA